MTHYATALLRVYNDIVTTVGKGNGARLVLLDLSAAFDTMYHVVLFEILVKYVGFKGKALDFIKSYFSDRTQRVQINGILSEIFGNCLWCSTGVSFGTFEILPLHATAECYFEVS